MNPTRLLAPAALLLVLGGGVVTVLLRPARPAADSPALPRADRALSPGALAPSAPAAAAEDTLEPTLAPRSAQGSAPRAAVAAAGAERIVQVIAPAGAPADPGLEVVAFDASALGGDAPATFLEELRSDPARAGVVRAAVGADGRARLALPGTMSEPQVLVDGRYLYLSEPRPAPAGGETLRLEPELGAALVVRLVAPDGEPVDGGLSLMGANFGRGFRFETREQPARGGERLEFRALDPEVTWTVSPDLEAHAAWPSSGVELEPGERREVELELMRGATVAGQLVDDAGRGLAGMTVRVAAAQPWMGREGGRSAETDAEGRFELRAILPGQQVIEAAPDGWVAARTDTLELADGEQRDGLRLVLSRGLSIAGIVQRADGRPAGGARVVVETRRTRGGFGGWGGPRLTRAGEATADDDGAFAVTGLEDGAYQVSAALQVAGETGAAVWRGLVEGVGAGARGVTISVEGPIAFAGRVVNDLGEPVAAFELQARSTRDGGPRETQAFEDAEGRFRFERAGAGEWELTASAPEHVQLEAVEVALPGAEEAELTLVLERRARVAGRVVDAGGAPVPAARVRADDGSGSGNPWMGPRGPVAETDAEGRFRFDALRPGTITLVAQAEGWADSEELAVAAQPGEVREEALLTLRVGGRIEGSLATPEGEPLSGKRVTWGENAMGFGSRGETRTDGAGRFVFEHVTPGDWSVSAAPSFAELGERMRGRRDESAFVEAMGDLVTATVTVADGETVEVFLGGEPKRPVRVFGTVTQAGAPLAGATAYAVSEESAIFQGMKSAQVAEDGSYEMVLDRPGSYVLSARAGGVGVELPVDVPRADEARFDLKVPLGGISGTVRAPGSGGAGGIRLALQREDGLGRVRWGGDTATTDDQGAYSFDALESGSYTVRANVAGWQGGAETSFGTSVRAGVSVDRDQETAGVDFQLVRSGVVEGVVRDPSGEPLGGVSVFFRGADGLLVSAVSGTVTDGRGGFRRDGLAPGSYTLSARAEGYAAGEEATVVVSEGQTAKVELAVEVGTLIEIVLEEGDEEVRRARFEVFDEEGREVGGLLTLAAIQALFNEGAASLQQRIGPFPAGRYRVRATLPDGRTTERTVRLRGRGETKRVRLKLGS